MAEQLESDDDVGVAAPPPQQQPAAQTQPPPAQGEQGRQVIVHARAPPKPPPKPIAPHEAVPLSVAPNAPAPSAVGQQPPQPSKIAHEESDDDVGVSQPGGSDEDIGIKKWPGWGPELGKSIQGGLAEGTAGLLGAPFDIPRLADYGLAWAGAHVNQAMGGEDAQEAMQRTHGSVLRQAIGDKTYDTLAQFIPTGADYQKEFLRSGVDPGYTPQSGVGRYLKTGASFIPGALMPFGEASTLARLKQAVGPAIGSETLGHAAEGTPYEPWARFGGSLIGGGTQMSGEAIAKPLTKSGQTDMAADMLREKATNPEAAAGNIRTAQAQTAPGRATGENISGSKPTASQVAVDPGLVGAETEYQTHYGVQHSQQWHAQQAAQTKALQGVQPGGDSTKVADLITQRLQQIEQQHEAEVANHAAGVQQAEAAAKGAAGQVARQGAPEALGANARKAIADSMATARAKEETLWRAIKADKIGVRPHQIGGQARKLQRQVGPMQKPMEGDEARIFDNASRLGKDVTRLSDVTDLTSDLKTAMRKERMSNGKTPALARMTQLLKTAENVIKNAATRQSAKEAEEDMGRLRAMTPQDRANIMAARAASRARGDIERGPAGAITRQGATADSYRTMESQVPGKIFAKGATGYQKAKAYADATGKPWIDPFKDVVSDSMAREATTNGMIDPAKLAKWQQDYEGALRALPADVRQNFVKGPAEAAAQLADDAANRRAAMIAHQKLDAGKAMRNDPAFKGFEGQTSPHDIQNLVGGLFSRKDAVRQMTRLQTFLASQPGGAAAVEGLKRAALDHMLDRVTTQMKAGVGSNVKTLSPGLTQKLVADYKPVMAAAGFTPQQLRVMDQVADDIERQQTLYTTTIPRGSPTAQKTAKALAKIAEHGTHGGLGVAGTIIAAHEIYHSLPEALHGVAGWTGAGAALAAQHFYAKARNAGIAKAEHLYHDAIMDPDKAADLLSRPNPNSYARLAEKYGRQGMFAGLASERHEELPSPLGWGLTANH
jgi:hypothetical protein